ncbi:hypothetical protein Tco_1024545 [Tanacetum coccineum]
MGKVRYGISKVFDTAYWEFLGVGTTFDIFQNILFLSGLNTAYWSSWIRRPSFQSAQQFQPAQQLQYGLSGPPGFGSPNMKPIAPPQASHQATMLPHAFQTMTLQEPAWNNGYWGILSPCREHRYAAPSI